MREPGRINNREHATQVRDFTGLRYGLITPTDLDGLLDFQNRGFVMIEAKYGDTPLPLGQRLALERVCRAIERGGTPAIVFVGRHYSTGDIDFANLDVVSVFKNNRWVPPTRPVRMREAVDIFRRLIGIR